MLPDPPPTVSPIRTVPLAPGDPRHATDVSDAHSLASHPVTPIRPAPLYPSTPSPAPLTVTHALPVPARFVVTTLHIDPMSNDTPSVIDPAATPDVTPTRSVPDTPLDR